MATIGAKLTGLSTLLWFDFVQKVSLEDVQSINEQLQQSTIDLDIKVIITCCDDCGAATPENLEEFECQQLDIGDETGVSNVFADDLHDEFKLMASWTLETSEPQPEPSASELASEPEPEAGTVSGDDPDEQPHCLLDVFEQEDLVAALRQQLSGRPLVAVYRTNDGDLLIRICVSDVGFLHELRDRLLQGTLCRDLEECLAGKPRRSGFEALRLTLAVDKSQFAERYEDAILNLNQLTPHQREKLAQCRAALDGHGKLAVHIRAPAGAGKTFVALHYMQSVLVDKTKTDKDKTPRVLFIARNTPLTIFVAKWLAQRCRVDSVRSRLLRRLHVISEPLSAGPQTVEIRNDTLVTAPVVSSKWERAKLMKYDLVVIDESHHLLRAAASRRLVEPFVQASERRVLLSDISQSLHEGIHYPDIGLHDVMLTEVVRSSKRIVAVSRQFQLAGSSEQEAIVAPTSRKAHR